MGLERMQFKNSGCLVNTKTQKAFEIHHNMTIGRGKDATVLIDDLKVSRKHLTILIDSNGTLWIQDSSTNGTFINGEKISGKIKITSDIKFKIGNTEMTLVLPLSKLFDEEVPLNQEGKSLSNLSQPLILVKNYTESFEDYPPAPMLRRFVATLIDRVLENLLCQIPLIILPKIGSNSPLIILTFYLGIFLVYYRNLNETGQSIGKKAMKLKIIRTNNSKGFSSLEILSREVFLKITFFLISVITVLFTKKKLAVHDLLLNTRVVDISKK